MTDDDLDACPTDGAPRPVSRAACGLHPRRYCLVPSILAVNVVLFAITLSDSPSWFESDVSTLLDWGANFGPRTLDGQWWRLFTSTFLHFDLVHLGLNMWVLWNVGRLVERLIGSTAFGLLYVVSGILGSVASLAWNSAVISAGASGAVFGVVGGLFAVVAMHRSAVPAAVFRSLRGSLIGFLGYNLLFGMLVPGIDMAAHLGGLAAGFVSGMLCSPRVTPTRSGERLLRYSALLAATTAVLLPAINYLPQPPVDVQHQLGQFAQLESQAINGLDALSHQSNGRLSDDQLARRVQRDIQPVWKECQRFVQAARQAPLADQAYIDRLVKYVALRQHSCDVLVEGLKQRDARKIRQFNQLYESANEMARTIDK